MFQEKFQLFEPDCFSAMMLRAVSGKQSRLYHQMQRRNFNYRSQKMFNSFREEFSSQAELPFELLFIQTVDVLCCRARVISRLRRELLSPKDGLLGNSRQKDSYEAVLVGKFLQPRRNSRRKNCFEYG